LKTAILIVLFVFLSGCNNIFSAIPIPLSYDGVKDYVIGQEESFSYPIDQVLESTIHNLHQMGFAIVRIERFEQKSLIHATWENTSVNLSMETIAPKLTKFTCKVGRGNGSREYSSEKELFCKVRETLKQSQTFDWGELARGMITVHFSPDENSRVIAYLKPGAETELIGEEGEWGKIALMDECAGYIALRHLRIEEDSYLLKRYDSR
ncbi:MAG: hypothetical protein IMF11_03685, partial [Proteobacteria bacterium]|nr:hypothetical protein [Pseudomonadota bacterium]